MAISLMETLLLGIAAQCNPEAASFHLVDMSSLDGPGAGTLASLVQSFPHRCEVVGRQKLSTKLESLRQELQRRISEDRPPQDNIFIALFGLHRMRDLHEVEGGGFASTDPSEALRAHVASLLREGPEVGIHIFAWTDTVTAAERIDRRLIHQFARRIIGPMAEQDSHRMMDTGDAAKLDRPHRLIRFDEDRPGDVVTFRPFAPPLINLDGSSADEPDAVEPYCPPGRNWFVGMAQKLRTRGTSL
jgi:S-DNA-T family DNA segregation ATPase FtsK/SpoIIIE